MKLRLLERMVVNSPIRALSLRTVEPLVFGQIAAFPPGADVLDLGCGNGEGLVMLHNNANPASLIGVDIDEDQLARARRKLGKNGVRATLLHASANKLPLPAQSLDVVTSFGAFHHIHAWQQAVAEVARTLRPGGLLFALEFYRPLLRALSPFIKHPQNRFSHQELKAELQRQGFIILGEKTVFNLWGFTVARQPASAESYD